MMILKQRISEVVRKEINDFRTQTVEITKGYRFSQYNNIRRINLYINDRFLEGDNGNIFWGFDFDIPIDIKVKQPSGNTYYLYQNMENVPLILIIIWYFYCKNGIIQTKLLDLKTKSPVF